MSAFLFSNPGHNALEAAQVEAYEAIRPRVTPAQYHVFMEAAAQRRASAWFSYGLQRAISAVLFTVIAALVLWYCVPPFFHAALPYAAFLSVCAVASSVFVLESILLASIGYSTGRLELEMTLPTVLPSIPKAAFGVFGAVNPFMLWWVVVTSVGVGQLVRTRAWKLAVGLLACYLLLAVTASYMPRISQAGIPSFHRGSR